MRPIPVGLAGAGPWASKAYAPMLAAGPETALSCVWARRPEAARSIAEAHGVPVAASFSDLLARCEAVAFAVPPGVQASLAIEAARAGKHLMLDKPLAFSLSDAERLVEAVESAGVVSQILLTHRFRPKTREFLAQAAKLSALGGRLAFLTRAFIDGPYANEWRREYGALYDLGPHAFDLLEACLGPIVRVSGRGDSRRWVSLVCEHEGGILSDVVMSGVVRMPQSVFRIELYGGEGALEFDAVAAAADEPWSAARREFAQAILLGRSGPLDARRGLELQRIIDQAARALV